ncbi:hypothetical protein BIFGAL_03026 [Bifidobacterium gallicum DSM 20093 = LMG 11596]|uniref:Uncharacterized protein n=1 Tax=Bifidobacterium gallicum DSM 20093 = LMG 11596 TaxID=561180 RepID=D1NRS7_9BIFI|nr:hypothetical protein BIFGAL_03026 [Bifidobacterium gallicum DSM 20093 = LMG 11596]
MALHTIGRRVFDMLDANIRFIKHRQLDVSAPQRENMLLEIRESTRSEYVLKPLEIRRAAYTGS